VSIRPTSNAARRMIGVQIAQVILDRPEPHATHRRTGESGASVRRHAPQRGIPGDRPDRRIPGCAVARGRRCFAGNGRIDGRQVVLAKPMTFMNLSGDAVAPLYGNTQTARRTCWSSTTTRSAGRRGAASSGAEGRAATTDCAPYRNASGQPIFSDRVGIGRPPAGSTRPTSS